MSGYYGFTKSNNAVAAEENSRFPASTLAKKLKVKTVAIKALMSTDEYHHTSCHFNCTDFYDGDLMLRIANGQTDLEDCFDADEILDAVALLDALRSWKAPEKGVKTWTSCKVRWIEWSGSRNHPKATECEEEDCTVEWKGGKFCTVTFASGNTMKKGVATNGFDVFDQDGNRVWF